MTEQASKVSTALSQDLAESENASVGFIVEVLKVSSTRAPCVIAEREALWR
jgi:hypothetical protein